MSGRTPPRFSLIVPTYHQEKTIVGTVRRLQKILSHLRYQSELIVVLDGPEKKSLVKLKKAHLLPLTIVSYPAHRGKSYAIRYGMKRAKGDYIMFMDAGEEINVSGISMLLEHLEWYDADIIVGSKRHPASYVNYTASRKILSTGYYWLVKLLFRVNVKDTQAGIKIFRKPVTEKIMPRLVEKRFAGDLEMLVVARHVGFQRIFEAPIRLDYRFSALTSAATWRSIVLILIDTLAIWYRLHLLHYYDMPHHRLTGKHSNRRRKKKV